MFPAPNLFDAIGVAGTVMILAAYALAQLGRLRQEHLVYLLLNLVGSGLVIVSLGDRFNLSALLLEVAWALISLGGIWGWWRRRRATGHSNPR